MRILDSGTVAQAQIPRILLSTSSCVSLEMSVMRDGGVADGLVPVGSEGTLVGSVG
jgi:hypothetical protein